MVKIMVDGKVKHVTRDDLAKMVDAKLILRDKSKANFFARSLKYTTK